MKRLNWNSDFVMILKNIEFITDVDFPKTAKQNYEYHVIRKYLDKGYLVRKNNLTPKGTPDLSIYDRGGKLQFMVEVKSPNDSIRVDQFRFIKDNPTIKVIIYKFLSETNQSELIAKNTIPLRLNDLTLELLKIVKENGKGLYFE